MRNALICILLVAPLTACLENEEEITIAEDGSLFVRILSTGDAVDLAGGHALPLSSPFRPVTRETNRWLATISPHAGGGRALEQVRAGAWKDEHDEPSDKATLEVEASFDSVSELPRFYAPDGEPYRHATLERCTALDVTMKGDRRVYVFERIYSRRPYVELGAGQELEDRLPEELTKRLGSEADGTPTLSGEEWQVVIDAVQEITRESAERFVEQSLKSVYTKGDASLSVAGWERVRARFIREVGEVVTLESLQSAVWIAAERSRARKSGAEEPRGPDPFNELEAGIRDAGRRALRSGLAEEGLTDEVVNAVAACLEWHISSLDHTTDIGDEKFRLIVNMPGTVVAGNYASVSDGTARFEFEGAELRDRELRLRAVSVLE